MQRNETPVVLLVDDRSLTFKVLESALANLDIEVERVCSGAAAVEFAKGREPALVLLDLEVSGLDGFATARQLATNAERRRSAPVIFVTAGARGRGAEAHDSGAVDYITKPLQPRLVRSKVRLYVELFVLRRRLAEQAEQIARLSDPSIVGEMNHELRSPLNAIIGFTQLMVDGKVGEPLPAHREYLEDVLSSAKQLQRVVNNLHEFEKVQRQHAARSFSAARLRVGGVK